MSALALLTHCPFALGLKTTIRSEQAHSSSCSLNRAAHGMPGFVESTIAVLFVV